MRTSRAWRHLGAVLLLITAAFNGLMVMASSSAVAAPMPEPGVVTKIAYGTDAQEWVQLTRPARSGRRPTVIFIHGGGWVAGGVSTWQPESAYWSARGWVSLNVSYRLGSSDDGTAQMGQNMLADMGAVLRLARSLTYVDRSRILVVGDSAGGHLAAYMASRYHGTVAGMILWSPVAAPSVAEQSGQAWDGVTDCAGVCAQQRSLGNRASRMFGYSPEETSPLTYLAQFGPVPTWVAGSAHEWVPFGVNGAALCAAASGECAEHLVDGDRHGTRLRDADRSLLISARHWAAKTVGVHAF